MVGSQSIAQALSEFSLKHELVVPQRECSDAEIALVECHHFSAAPIAVECEIVESVPTQEQDLRASKYLWVIAENHVPFGKEVSADVEIKHTKLTGGGRAYCGGEVWFADKESIYLNGGSGRYPCENDETLLESVKCFYMDIGYRVAIPPFDDDMGTRPRVFKSEAMVEWEQRDHQN